jgi:hypothetical protein
MMSKTTSFAQETTKPTNYRHKIVTMQKKRHEDTFEMRTSMGANIISYNFKSCWLLKVLSRIVQSFEEDPQL